LRVEIFSTSQIGTECLKDSDIHLGSYGDITRSGRVGQVGKKALGAEETQATANPNDDRWNPYQEFIADRTNR
jgi:hypothetical protein